MRKPLGKVRNESQKRELRRKLSIRKKISGTSEHPRLCIMKTNRHLQVQVIDDVTSRTLFSLQTFGKNKVADQKSKESAKLIGTKLAEALKQRKIESAVFDRNGKRYSGMLTILADSLRQNGIRI